MQCLAFLFWATVETCWCNIKAKMVFRTKEFQATQMVWNGTDFWSPKWAWLPIRPIPTGHFNTLLRTIVVETTQGTVIKLMFVLYFVSQLLDVRLIWLKFNTANAKFRHPFLQFCCGGGGFKLRWAKAESGGPNTLTMHTPLFDWISLYYLMAVYVQQIF